MSMKRGIVNMSENVVKLAAVPSLDTPATSILDEAKEHGLRDAVVIGFDSDGVFYFASSAADAGSVLYFLEMAKKQLLEAAS